MDADLLERKNVLRAEMRRRLDALAPDERRERSRRLVENLAALPAWRDAASVLLFAPLPAEPDLDLLWTDGALAGKRCAYPRVEGAAVRLYHVNGPGELEPTRWGLREPPPLAAREADPEDFDLVLVPGMAFDMAGGRLGRGGGYYDRLLAGRRATTRLVGVGFIFQVVPVSVLPLAAHDVRMDVVCTDDVWTGGNAAGRDAR